MVVGDKIIAVHVGGDKAKFNVGRIIDHALIQQVREWGEQLRVDKYYISKEKTCQHSKLVLRSNKIIEKKEAVIDAKTQVTKSSYEESKTELKLKEAKGKE